MTPTTQGHGTPQGPDTAERSYRSDHTTPPTPCPLDVRHVYVGVSSVPKFKYGALPPSERGHPCTTTCGEGREEEEEV